LAVNINSDYRNIQHFIKLGTIYDLEPANNKVHVIAWYYCSFQN